MGSNVIMEGTSRVASMMSEIAILRQLSGPRRTIRLKLNRCFDSAVGSFFWKFPFAENVRHRLTKHWMTTIELGVSHSAVRVHLKRNHHWTFYSRKPCKWGISG